MNYAYSNNGLSFRAVDEESDCVEGEVFFAGAPTETALEEAFSGYAAAANALAAQAAYASAIAAGVTISSTGIPALNGIYAITPQACALITSEQVNIAATAAQSTAKFTNGQTTRNWQDQSGALHLFPSPAEFTLFAEAVASYVDALYAALQMALINNTAWAAPAMPGAIA
jgi:hypothetical protein